jgi:mannan endo-1,4-beta-mannosidase
MKAAGHERSSSVIGVIMGVMLSLAIVGASSAVRPPSKDYVQASGTGFMVNGQPFFVMGVNNHYVTWGSPAEVLRVLDDAVALGANTLRLFLMPVIGSLDGSVPTIWDWNKKGDSSHLSVNGTYLLYWDSEKSQMAINDGPDGMQKIDFLIAEAGKRDLRLIIAFLDFWDYTGGSQQIRAWYGRHSKDRFFFRDPRPKRDYKNWVRHVVQRVNRLTGLAYRDDPTIMAWELMNEGNAKPEALRLAWTAEMSAYVKSLDPKHLVSSGHANVTSKLADMSIPTLDFGTWHGYPLYYGLSVQQFNDAIREFCALAVRHKKPVLMEEFGYARSNPDAAEAYALWLDTVTRNPNCAGWLVWVLVSRQDSGGFPADEHSQFDVRRDGNPIWHALKAATARGRAERGARPTVRYESP